MAPVSALNSTAHQPAPLTLPTNPQDCRVAEASKSVFERMKDTFFSTWTIVELAFFRVLEWFQPIFGPRIEVIFLRARDVFRSIRDGWRQDEIQREMNLLRAENGALRSQIALNQSHHAIQIQDLHATHSRIEEQRRAQGDQQNHIDSQNTHLAAEVARLRERNNALAAESVELASLRNQNTELQRLLAAYQQQGPMSQPADFSALKTCVSRLTQVCSQFSNNSGTASIDHSIGETLPLLITHIRRNLALLTSYEEPLAQTAARFPLAGLKEQLGLTVQILDAVQRTVQLQQSLQEPLYQIGVKG